MKYLLIFSLFCSTTAIAEESSWKTDAWKVLEIVQAFLSDELSEQQFSERVLSLKQSMGEESKKQFVHEVCPEPQVVNTTPYQVCWKPQISLEINPGFNCAIAKTPTEHAICGNQQLKLYDLEMSFLYFKKISNGEITKEQGNWKKRRDNSCGANVACLTRIYQEKISQLK